MANMHETWYSLPPVITPSHPKNDVSRMHIQRSHIGTIHYLGAGEACWGQGIAEDCVSTCLQICLKA